MKAYKKMIAVFGAALVLAGPVAHAPVAHGAQSQQTATATDTSTSGENDLGTTFAASATHERRLINFADYSNYDDLYKHYPDTREIIDAFGMHTEKQHLPESAQVYQIGTFYLFRLDGDGYCGSLGCTLRGYSLGQDGYYNSLYVVVHEPVRYSLHDHDQFVLYLCGTDGRQVAWSMGADGKMQPIAAEIDTAQPGCDVDSAPAITLPRQPGARP